MTHPMPFPRPRSRPDNAPTSGPEHLPKRVPGAALRGASAARTSVPGDHPPLAWRPYPPARLSLRAWVARVLRSPVRRRH